MTFSRSNFRINVLVCAGAALTSVGFGSSASEYVPDVITDHVVHACNGCTLAQVETKAESLGRGSHYVYDMPNNKLYLFSVECEPIFGGIQCYAEEEIPDSETGALFVAYHTAYQDAGNNEHLNEHLPYDHTGPGTGHDNGHVNAYDTIRDSSVNITLMSWLNVPANHRADLRTIVQGLIDGNKEFEGFTIVDVVEFDDGSVRTFSWDKNSASFKAVPNTAIDSNGNQLADQRGGPGQGDYHFSHGVNYDYNPPNVAWLLDTELSDDLPPGSYICTWDGERLTCPAPR